jgi:hypothetical protein
MVRWVNLTALSSRNLRSRRGRSISFRGAMAPDRTQELAVPGFFDSQLLDIACPGCAHRTRKTFGWLQSHTHFICVCGAKVRLGTKDFARPLKKVERECSHAFHDTKST